MGSPAGRRIGLAAGAALTLVAALAPAASGAPEDKRELAVITATGQAHQFRVIEPGGAPVRTVFARSSGFGIASPSWSRDEKTLAYSESQQVFVVPAEGGAEQPVTSGSLPAFSPAGDELAFWRGRELRAIRPDGTGDRLIAGPFATTPLSPPAWSPDGSFLAVAIGGAILRQPAAGGPATVIAAPAADEILSRPALAPDGKQIAFAREFFANVPAGTPRAGDQLVVRDLASGGEHLAWQGPDPGVQGFAGFASTYGGISWSADSDRIAYPELDPTPTNRLVTVKSDGSGDRKVLVDNTLIQGAAWANAPRLPSYSVRHVEVTQALSPTLVPPLQFDPPAGEPYALAWSQPAPFGFGLPLIAGKSTLLRVYVADASLPPGASATRTLRVSLVDATSGIDYGAGPDRAVTVTAPDVAPQQEQEGAALNVWVAPEAAAAGAPRTFSVDVNPGEVLPECVGCYPKGNHAEVTTGPLRRRREPRHRAGADQRDHAGQPHGAHAGSGEAPGRARRGGGDAARGRRGPRSASRPVPCWSSSATSRRTRAATSCSRSCWRGGAERATSCRERARLPARERSAGSATPARCSSAGTPSAGARGSCRAATS